MSKVYGVGFPPVASNYCCSQPSQGSMYSVRALIQYIISLLSQEGRFLVSGSAQYTACLQEFKNPHEVVYLCRKAFKGCIDFRPFFPSLHNPYGTVDPLEYQVHEGLCQNVLRWILEEYNCLGTLL
jgi:hypothetical protein